MSERGCTLACTHAHTCAVILRIMEQKIYFNLVDSWLSQNVSAEYACLSISEYRHRSLNRSFPEQQIRCRFRGLEKFFRWHQTPENDALPKGSPPDNTFPMGQVLLHPQVLQYLFDIRTNELWKICDALYLPFFSEYHLMCIILTISWNSEASPCRMWICI